MQQRTSTVTAIRNVVCARVDNDAVLSVRLHLSISMQLKMLVLFKYRQTVFLSF